MDDSGDVTCDPQLWEGLFSEKQQAGTGCLFLVIMGPVLQEAGFSLHRPSGSREDMEEPGKVRKVIIFVLQSRQHCVQETTPLSLHLPALSYSLLWIALQGWPLGG